MKDQVDFKREQIVTNEGGKRKVKTILTPKEVEHVKKSSQLRDQLQKIIDTNDSSEEAKASAEFIIGELLNANQLMIKFITHWLSDVGRDKLSPAILNSNSTYLQNISKNLAQVNACINQMPEMPTMKFEDKFINAMNNLNEMSAPINQSNIANQTQPQQ